MRLGIIGGGRAAWAFGSAWRRIGWPVAGVWLRDDSHSHIAELLQTARLDIHDVAAESELLLVAVPDSAVVPVAESIPASDAIIFHASGALPAQRGGFSLHPLKSLPPVGEPSDLVDTLLVFEGEHRKTAKLISRAIGGRFAEISASQKALYHAGAVFGSNYVAAVLEIAAQLTARAGIPATPDDLVALARSAAEIWRAGEGSKRFTGPAVRGDATTMASHLAALDCDPQLAEIYRRLAAVITGTNLATKV